MKQIFAGLFSLIAFVLFAISAHGIFSSNSELYQAQQAVRINQLTIRNYHKRTADLTKDEVAKNVSKNAINLEAAKKNSSDRITNAFNTAYGNVDNDGYKKARKTIMKQLGPQFGNYLAGIIAPNGGDPYSNKIVDMKLGYGRLNEDTKVIPIAITVKYNGKENSDEANDYWTVDYNAKTKQFSNANRSIVKAPQGVSAKQSQDDSGNQ